MEIERKYLIHDIPEDIERFPYHDIEQAYLCTEPVVRIRRSDEEYYLTYKGKGLLAREEYNLPLTKEAYEHLLEKADGIILTKRRYLIPLQDQADADCKSAADQADLTIELDIFSGKYQGLQLAEIEFPTVEMAENFTPPAWFGKDVTFSGEYQNSKLSRG